MSDAIGFTRENKTGEVVACWRWPKKDRWKRNYEGKKGYVYVPSNNIQLRKYKIWLLRAIKTADMKECIAMMGYRTAGDYDDGEDFLRKS